MAVEVPTARVASSAAAAVTSAAGAASAAITDAFTTRGDARMADVYFASGSAQCRPARTATP